MDLFDTADFFLNRKGQIDRQMIQRWLRRQNRLNISDCNDLFHMANAESPVDGYRNLAGKKEGQYDNIELDRIRQQHADIFSRQLPEWLGEADDEQLQAMVRGQSI